VSSQGEIVITGHVNYIITLIDGFVKADWKVVG